MRADEPSVWVAVRDSRQASRGVSVSVGERPRRIPAAAERSVHRSPANRGPHLDVRAQPTRRLLRQRSGVHSRPTSGVPASHRHRRARRTRRRPLAARRALRPARPGPPGPGRHRRRHRQRRRLRPAAHRGPRRPTGCCTWPAAPDSAPPSTRPTRVAGPLPPEDLPYLPAPHRLGPGHPDLERRRLRPARAAARSTPSSGSGCCTTTANRPPTPSPNCCGSPTPRRPPPSSAPSCAAGTTGGQLLEVGVSIARSGRRWTGLERREQDQGQHDQVRPVLSVSSRRHAGAPRRVGGARRLRPPTAPDARRRRLLLARPRRRPHRGRRPRRRPAARRGRLAASAAPSTAPDAPSQPAPGRQGRRRLHAARQHPRRRCCPYVAAAASSSAPCCAPSATWSARCRARRSTRSPAWPACCCARNASCGARREQRPARHRPPDELRALFPPPGATVRATVEQVASNLVGPQRAPTPPRPAGTAAPSSPGPATTTPTSWRSSSSPGSSGSPASPARCSSPSCWSSPSSPAGNLLGGGALSGGALLPAPSGASDLWGAYAGALAPGRRRQHRRRAAVPGDRSPCCRPCCSAAPAWR